MVFIDGLLGADARKDALAAAAEAGEEVRLNKALGNDEVTFQRQTVDAESRAGGQLAAGLLKELDGDLGARIQHAVGCTAQVAQVDQPLLDVLQ